VADDKRIINLSQRSSKLQSQKFKENTSMVFPVSAGKVLKGFIVQIKGYVTPTFTGAPVLNQHGIMAALINAISFVDDKGNTYKKVTPEWMRWQARMLLGSPAPEYYKANSTTLTTAPSKGDVTTPFAIGTSTQNVAVFSALEVSFENKISSSWAKTFLALRSNISSYIQIDTKALKDIEKAIASPLISACTGDIDVEIQLIEAPKEMSDTPFDVFRQSFIQQRISGQLNSYPIELSRSGSIQGIRIALSQDIGLNRVSMDVASNTRLKLIRDGSEIIRDVTLLNLMSENASKRFLDDVIPGTAYMSLLNNQDYNTALPARSFTKLELEVSTDASMTYSPTALLEIGVDEILSSLN
jgi:hypothetical protein